MATAYDESSQRPANLDAAADAAITSDSSFVVADPSSIDEVYSQILLRIFKGDLPGGSVLTSTRLAKQLHVSRTPVAAALDRLVADGILQKERNRRAVVREGAEHWLAQVHQLREMIEPPATGLAAARITDEALAELDRLARAVEPNVNPNWLLAGRKFDHAIHLAVANHCGNLPLRKTIYKCWSYKRLIFDVGYNEPVAAENGYREHLAILQALLRRDAATASAAMLFHLRSAACVRTDLGID